MRKLLYLVIILVFISSTVFSESVFLPGYRQAKTRTNVGWGLTGIGTLLVIVGVGLGFSNSNTADPNDTSVNLTPLFVSGIGGGMIGGGVGLALQNRTHVERLELAMDIEPQLSNRERDAILEEKVFVGMSERALRASFGPPADINRSSYGADQYVYSGIYVYLEDGEVDGWN